MNTIENSALIIVDVQNYFFKKGSYAYIKGSENIIRPINNLIELFSNKRKDVVFTMQTFPISPSHPMRRWWRRLPKGDECRLFDRLILPKRKIIVEKEFYSVFFNTDLDELLFNRKVKRLFFCGVMTHLCVETSIRDAFMRGYESFLIEDATMSKRREYHKASILNLSHGFCKILRSRDINANL
ncbi:MAG: cysteine hydrolase family protein [Myxococcota bacterium]